MKDHPMITDKAALADELERLCHAETEGKFLDCVTDNFSAILAALRASPAADGAGLREAWPEGLAKRCEEILDWDRTGLLVDGELRKMADEVAGDGIPEHNCLRLAEDKTTRQAMQEIVRRAVPPAIAPVASAHTVHDYVANYEFRGVGDGYDHVPNDGERELIEDAIEGYLATLPVASAPTGDDVREALDLKAWKNGRLEACDLQEFIQSLQRYAGWADQEFGTRSDPAAHIGERLNAAAAVLAALPASAGVDETAQHIGWLKQYIVGMDESNWKDMRLRAERQLDQLSADLALSSPNANPTENIEGGK